MVKSAPIFVGIPFAIDTPPLEKFVMLPVPYFFVTVLIAVDPSTVVVFGLGAESVRLCEPFAPSNL
jgi:hypothetical protein